MKACYGTTKYCNAFLKGIPCNNTDCLYLHAEGELPATPHAAAWACAAQAMFHTALAWPISARADGTQLCSFG